jgi:hypothetical protein
VATTVILRSGEGGERLREGEGEGETHGEGEGETHGEREIQRDLTGRRAAQGRDLGIGRYPCLFDTSQCY